MTMWDPGIADFQFVQYSSLSLPIYNDSTELNCVYLWWAMSAKFDHFFNHNSKSSWTFGLGKGFRLVLFSIIIFIYVMLRSNYCIIVIIHSEAGLYTALRWTASVQNGQISSIRAKTYKRSELVWSKYKCLMLFSEYFDIENRTVQSLSTLSRSKTFSSIIDTHIGLNKIHCIHRQQKKFQLCMLVIRSVAVHDRFFKFRTVIRTLGVFLCSLNRRWRASWVLYRSLSKNFFLQVEQIPSQLRLASISRVPNSD